MALYDEVKDKYLYSAKDFRNIQDYKLGDIVEAEIGVFMQVVDTQKSVVPELSKVVTERLLVIPETDIYRNKYEWENATNDILLDLICNAEDVEEKNLYLHLMNHVKELYSYEKFKEKLGAIRE